MSTFFILGAPAFLAAAILCRRSAAAIPHYFLFFCSSPKELLCRSFSPTKNTKRTFVIFASALTQPGPKHKNLLDKVFFLQPKSHIHQNNQSRHFHQRTNNTRKGLPTINSENTYRNRNRQLKIVSRCSKR